MVLYLFYCAIKSIFQQCVAACFTTCLLCSFSLITLMNCHFFLSVAPFVWIRSLSNFIWSILFMIVYSAKALSSLSRSVRHCVLSACCSISSSFVDFYYSGSFQYSLQMAIAVVIVCQHDVCYSPF